MIDDPILAATLREALRAGGDFAEVYVEDRSSTGASLDDGKIEDVVSGRDRGAGIRVVAGETTGFAHTADLTAAGLTRAAQAAAAAARGTPSGQRTVDLTRRSSPRASDPRIVPSSVAKSDKVALLHRANIAARDQGAAVSQVAASYQDSHRLVQIANSDGVLVDDEIVRTIVSISCVATGDTGLQTGRETVGGTVGFELFDDHEIEELARRAADRALRKLAARPAPSGSMPVVIAAGSGGILFHEACGHGLEADLIAKGASVFADRIGEQVAAPTVTLVDDGTLAGEWGRLGVDDEGRPAQRNVLISDGVLTDYLWDHLRARKAGRSSSGNGRRQSYRHLPMVRMTNTFLGPGTDKADDIVADTPRGVYVAQLGGGQVNTATGDFVFGMTEAYLIENGEITDPIRDGNLIGNGPEALTAIDGLADDFSMGSPGTCGKDGQGVPVGTGTPTLRVAKLTVGGTAA